MNVSAVIIAKNEARHIERCLRSLRWLDEVIVVDDDSTDATASLAKKHGAKIIVHTFEDFAQQRNIGVRAAKGDWILSLDADEETPLESVPLFKATLENADSGTDAFRILRRTVVMGRWLRHGEMYGKKIAWYDWFRMQRHGYHRGEHIGGGVKLFRRQAGLFQGKIHEYPVVAGQTKQSQAYVNHYTADSVNEIFDKLKYAGPHASMIFEKKESMPVRPWTLFFKRPLSLFFNHLIRKRGFLDGFPGLMQILADANYELLKNVKWYDLYMRNARNGAGQAENDRQTGN